MAHFTTSEQKQQKAMRSANVTISEAAREREKGRIGAHGARGSESPGLAHFSLGWKKQREENDTAGHNKVVRTLLKQFVNLLVVSNTLLFSIII